MPDRLASLSSGAFPKTGLLCTERFLVGSGSDCSFGIGCLRLGQTAEVGKQSCERTFQECEQQRLSSQRGIGKDKSRGLFHNRLTVRSENVLDQCRCGERSTLQFCGFDNSQTAQGEKDP